MGCYDLAGRRVWERQWRPWSPDDGYPFNKQFEPIDVGDCVLNLVRPAEKAALFAEIHRVLKRGGRAIISDIVSELEKRNAA